MPGEGHLLTAAATLLAAACYLVVALEVGRTKARRHRQAVSTVAFFLLTSLFLLFAGARQVAAWAALSDPRFEGWDRAIFLVLLPPAAFAIVPLAHLAAYLRWGDGRVALAVAAAFAAAAGVGLAFAYAGGVEGPLASAWGTEWRLRSRVAQATILLVLTVPGLLASALLVRSGRALAGLDRRRVTMVGWACAVHYGVFALDALGLPGLLLVLARLVLAGSGIAAFLAYRPHVWGDGPAPREGAIDARAR